MVYEWTEEEEERLGEMLGDKNSPAVIAEALGIPVASVCGKISQRLRGRKGAATTKAGGPVVITSFASPVHVCVEQDARMFRKYLAVANTCKAAGVPMPTQVAAFFGVAAGEHDAINPQAAPVRYLAVREERNADGSLRGYAVKLDQVNGAKELLIVIGDAE